ncbi:hypothetical protein BGZ50_001216 [Haplosporangium sp. Z 11]|nr:hypothetical protein BGZ50_001216 [Haplosporangium sp. Z 11]
MRGSGKGKDLEDYGEDQFLHQTIGGSRIRSHSAKHGSHRINRHHQFTTSSSSLSSTGATTPGAAGTTASSVSAYLENLPSLNLGANSTPPPRPPRPPGGLLGISNGRGIGYGRSLGSSYDSPLTIHSSFNGHVRSGANLYGGRNQSSGLAPTKSSIVSHRPSTSVFPIQKALEIAIKESRLLAAASSRGGAGSSGTGMSTGITFVRELRRARHARGAILMEHGPTPDISLDEEDEEGEAHAGAMDVVDSHIKATTTEGDNITGNRFTRTTNAAHNPGTHTIMVSRPTVASYDPAPRGHYPGIAYLPHTLTPRTGAVAVSLSRSLRNIMPSRSWQSSESSSPPSLSASVSSQHLSSTSSSSMGTIFTCSASTATSSSSSSTPYQPHFTRLFSCLPASPSSGTSSHSAVHAVRELLDSYPAPSPYCVDDKKRSPLHFAAASGDLELVEFLLERGVRPDCGRDIAGNMPLHLGADMTLESPMTHKTPLDLAESRLSYLLSRAQESNKQQQQSGAIDLFNSQVATRSSFHTPSSQSPALLYQIKGIVNLLRPYVVRQQKLQHGERQKGRQKERSWERADKYMRQQPQDSSSSSGSGLWRVDPHSDGNYGDMEDEDEDEDDEEDEDDQMDTGEGQRVMRRKMPGPDHDREMMHHDDEDVLPPYTEKWLKHGRQPGRRMDAHETEEALESLMNGLSLLEANRKQQEEQQQQQQMHLSGVQPGAYGHSAPGTDIADGNLADSELDPQSEQQDVDEALPDLLEQVQQVLQAIKLNEHNGS